MKNRMIAFFLTAVMLFALLPATALAAGAAKNRYDQTVDPEYWIQDNSYKSLIDLCQGNSNCAHSPIIYYGTDLNGAPMPYYLIDSQYDRFDGTYLTLLAKNCVSEAYFDNLRGTKSGDYVGSALQTATEAMVGRLSDYEKAVVLKETVDAAAYSASEPYCDGVAATQLVEPSFRPLTTEEAAKLDPAIRNIGKDYWLCSPGAEANTAAYVDASGNVVAAGSAVDGAQRGVRPVLILNTDYIEIASFAVGGKDEKAFLQDTAAKNPNNEWKLTIRGEAYENHESAELTIADRSGDGDLFSYTLNLTGGSAGDHVVLYTKNAPFRMDAGVLAGTENQKISFLLPPFYAASGNLAINYERWNGDKKTDVVLTFLKDYGIMSLPARARAELQYNAIYLRPGDKMGMQIEQPWNNGAGTTVTLTSSDPGVARATVFHQGAEGMLFGLSEVVAVGVGEATITATFSNGLTETCRVIVARPSNVDYSVTGISTVKEFEDFALQTRLGNCGSYLNPTKDEEGYYKSVQKENITEANSYLGKTVELKADIGSESERVTIGMGSFYGVLKGNGHTVWTDIRDKNAPGLCSLNYGMIRDLTVCGSVARIGFEPSTHYCGAVAAQNFGTIYHCTNRATVTWINWLCREDGEVSESAVGGIAGDNGGMIDGCVNLGKVVIPYGYKSYVGGIVGAHWSSGRPLVKNCVNAGEVRVFTTTVDCGWGGICGYALQGDIHNSINALPDVGIAFFNGDLTNRIVNCYSASETSLRAWHSEHSCVYHSREGGYGGMTGFTYVSPANVRARSGVGALVTLLNSYKDPNTGAYPKDWMTWGFQGNNDYPTPIIGSQKDTETVIYLDENGRQCAAEAKILSKETLDTVLHDSGSPVFVVEGEVDLTKLIDQDLYEMGLGIKILSECALILKDGSKLVIPEGITNLSWPMTGGLTVYAQSTGSQAGELVLGGAENYRAAYEGRHLTVNGGKVSAASNFGGGVVEAYALTVNGGEVALNAFEEAPLLTHAEPNYIFTGKLAKFQACHVTVPADYAVKKSKDGDAFDRGTASAWEDVLSPKMPEEYEGPCLYPASAWIGAATAPGPKTEVSFDPAFSVNGGKPYAYGDALMKKLPTVFSEGVPLSPQPEIVCLYYKNDGTAEAPVKGKLLTSAPTDIGNYIVDILISAADKRYTGSITQSFGIARKQITVKAKDKHAFVGDAVPTLGAEDFTVTGLVGKDTLIKKPVLSYQTEPDMTRAGTAKIAAGKADAGSNYIINYEEGTLTVDPRPSSGGGTFSVDAAALAQMLQVQNQIVLTVGSKDAIVFGETRTSDVAPIIRNNRTMLPARLVAEALGATVEWNAAKKVVTITKNALTITITIGSDKVFVNGIPLLLDSPAFIENNRTYLPLRFVAEALGAQVEWNEETRQVIITRR